MNQRIFSEFCLKQLTMSRVNDSETVVVLTRGDELHEYADAFMWSAQQLGAKAYHLRLPDSPDLSGTSGVGDSGLAAVPLAVDALKAADMVIDCAGMLWSKEQVEIQSSGTRVLTVLEPMDVLARLMPTEELRKRVEVGHRLISKASSLRILNDWGTDVTYQLGKYPTMSQYGFTDEPGRWDHWGTAFTFTGGSDDGVDGTIVLGPGDIIHPFDTYVQNPVKFTIESGFIREISGLEGKSDLDADLVKAYIEDFQDPRGYGMSHVGFGLDERARWHSMRQDAIGVETRSFYGNVMISTGPNNELGGPNDTPCHIDIPMRNCSLYLDEELVLDHGEFTVPDLRPDSRR
ncbi:MAG: leucyl aminopeptidase [Hyphomicrobiales bacterium]|nr:MAG: leucyl aminopeptidase [Hyphomicrobiales bacterium]